MSTAKPWYRRIRWVGFVWIALLMFGQYRRHHYGSDIIETFAVFGLMLTLALQNRDDTESDKGKSILRIVFGSFAVIAFIFLVMSIARHGLRL